MLLSAVPADRISLQARESVLDLCRLDSIQAAVRRGGSLSRAAVDTKEAELSAGEMKNVDRSRYWDSKWDSVLEELHKMGFEDVDKNKRLVSANFGELKSVVKCLITDERSNAVRDQNKRMHAQVGLLDRCGL